MKIKLLIVAFLVSTLILGSAAIEAYAFGHCEKGGYYSSLECKFFKKAKLMLSYKEELGLSDEQIKKIKALKLETEKSLIKTDAEIDVIALDIKAEMWMDPLDTNAVNKLVDKKYELKKGKAKSLVAAYAELKGILTEEQKAKMKELYKGSKKK